MAKLACFTVAIDLFGKEFLESIDRAEEDIYQKRVKKISSFSELLRR